MDKSNYPRGTGDIADNILRSNAYGQRRDDAQSQGRQTPRGPSPKHARSKSHSKSANVTPSHERQSSDENFELQESPPSGKSVDSPANALNAFDAGGPLHPDYSGRSRSRHVSMQGWVDNHNFNWHEGQDSVPDLPEMAPAIQAVHRDSREALLYPDGGVGQGGRMSSRSLHSMADHDPEMGGGDQRGPRHRSRSRQSVEYPDLRGGRDDFDHKFGGFRTQSQQSLSSYHNHASSIYNPPIKMENRIKHHEYKYEMERLHPFRETLFIGVVVAAQFMALAGLGQSVVPMNAIAKGLNVTRPGEEAWFAAAYSLTVGTFILIAGRIGDIIGHKRVFIFGYFWLGVWSFAAGFAGFLPRQSFFDVCRAMQGIGSSLLAPNALAMLGRAYAPSMKKNLVFSLFGAMAPWGFIIGAVSGSLFSQLTWWPWTFWSYGIAAWSLSAFALMVVPRSLGYDAQFAGGHEKPGMDYIGCILGVSGLVLVNFSFNSGPLEGWGTPYVYFILVIGVFSLVMFILFERFAASPLLPIKMLNAQAAWVLALIGLGWGSFGIWIFYSVRLLLDFRMYSPLSVCAQLVPALVTGLLAAGMTGFMLTHTPVSFTMMFSMVFFALANIVAGTMPVHQIYWAGFFVSVTLAPFGMDMSFPAATLIISNTMPQEHQGLAASLVNTVVNYSISISLGVAGTVEAAVNNGGATPEDVAWGIQCAYYTGIGFSCFGVVLGVIYFIVSFMKEGWRVEPH